MDHICDGILTRLDAVGNANRGRISRTASTCVGRACCKFASYRFPIDANSPQSGNGRSRLKRGKLAGYIAPSLSSRRSGGAGSGGDFVEALADAIPEGRHGSPRGFSRMRFELGQGEFDGVQVGRAGPRQAQLGSGAADRLAHAADLVGGRIVHRHDVVRRQGDLARSRDAACWGGSSAWTRRRTPPGRPSEASAGRAAHCALRRSGSTSNTAMPRPHKDPR